MNRAENHVANVQAFRKLIREQYNPENPGGVGVTMAQAWLLEAQERGLPDHRYEEFGAAVLFGMARPIKVAIGMNKALNWVGDTAAKAVVFLMEASKS